MTMKKTVFITAALVLLAACGVSPAAAMTPGAYILSNGVMTGVFELYETGAAYRAHIKLVRTQSSHVADFEGPATVEGEGLVIKSTMGDGAMIAITFKDGFADVEANDEAETLYCGRNATFNGRYRCEPAP
jgi:hypothetical protein